MTAAEIITIDARPHSRRLLLVSCLSSMPIQVTCPACLKRFQVSEKFAGKKGPCPNCKNQIKVPETSEEVVIHAPEDDAPKDRSGQSVLKPIVRTETEVTRKGLILTIVSVVAAVVLAVVLRFTTDPVPVVVRIVAAIVFAPPLVWAGYSFVRDSELDAYRGSELRDRVLICSGLLSALWIVYAFVPTYLFDLVDPSQMDFITFGIMMAVMLAIGGVISSACFELEYFSGVIHGGVYILATLLLAVMAGIPLVGVTEEEADQANADVGIVDALVDVGWSNRVVRPLVRTPVEPIPAVFEPAVGMLAADSLGSGIAR